MESLLPHIQGGKGGYVGERLQKERMRYNLLNEEKQRIQADIGNLLQKILNLEHSKAE